MDQRTPAVDQDQLFDDADSVDEALVTGAAQLHASVATDKALQMDIVLDDPAEEAARAERAESARHLHTRPQRTHCLQQHYRDAILS